MKKVSVISVTKINRYPNSVLVSDLCFAAKLNCWEAFEVTGPLCFTMAGS